MRLAIPHLLPLLALLACSKVGGGTTATTSSGGAGGSATSGSTTSGSTTSGSTTSGSTTSGSTASGSGGTSGSTTSSSTSSSTVAYVPSPDDASCGMCGPWNNNCESDHTCSACEPPDGGKITHCAAGVCERSCPSGFALCTRTPPCSPGPVQSCLNPDICANIRADADNCGACGVVCPTGSCVDGVCRPQVPRVLVASASFSELAVDDTYVYFKDDATHTLGRVPKLGGAVETIGDAAAYAATTQITLDGSDLVLGASRMPKAGGTVLTVVTEKATSNFAVDATDLYYFHEVPPPIGIGANKVELHRVPKLGGTPAMLLKVGDSTQDMGVVRVDNEHVWLNVGLFGRRAGWRKDGSGVDELLAGGYIFMDVSDNYIYISDNDYSMVFDRVPKNATQTFTSSWPYYQSEIVVGNPYIYYWNSTAATTQHTKSGKTLRCGGSPVPGPAAYLVLSASELDPYPSRPALDDQALYVVKNGQLLRLPQ